MNKRIVGKKPAAFGAGVKPEEKKEPTPLKRVERFPVTREPRKS